MIWTTNTPWWTFQRDNDLQVQDDGNIVAYSQYGTYPRISFAYWASTR